MPTREIHKAEPGAPALRGAAPAQNRSLERGIALLRAFRPGSGLLGNGELAERTGLPRATVSRLTQTLVQAGMLEYDGMARAYRLAAPVLSLAHAMRMGSDVLQAATPLMRAHAEKLRINVGLACADGEDMVYLASIRYNRRASLRSVVAGQRVPMALTSLGRAYLAALEEPARERAMAALGASRRRTGWSALRDDILRAVADVRQQGYCAASWQPEVVALATPLRLPGHGVHVVNASVTSTRPLDEVVAELRQPLLALAGRIEQALGAARR